MREKCAVFGIFVPELEVARVAVYGLWALQHRGQEGTGIVSSDGRKLYKHVGEGLVSQVFSESSTDKLRGHIAIGHNRYSTTDTARAHHIQPLLDLEHGFALAHNGNIPDCAKMIKFLGERGVDTRWLSDSGMMLAVIGYYMSEENLALEAAIKRAWPLFTGAFSIVAMDHDKLVAFRDKRGIRPLSIARLGGGYVVASETCAFDTIGAQFLRDVEPGEMVVIDAEGLSSIQVEKGHETLDIFELIYFARPDSVVSGLSVNKVRKDFGRRMAREFKIKADVVVPVPSSGIPAALGYAEESGIPFDMGLVKNRYIHRTFIHPTPELREHDLSIKLNPVVDSIRGKRIILVDDSIVRGTTMRKLVKMVFAAGAAEVHLAIGSPPVKFPDFYGINTPDMAELIATYMTEDQICNFVGATSLNYISFDGMIKATGRTRGDFSTACFDGNYPLSIGSRARTLKAEPPTRIAIMASGNGTTAESIIRAAAGDKMFAEVPLVITSKPDAGVIERVKKLKKELGLKVEVAVVGKTTHPPTAKENLGAGEMSRAEEKAIMDLLKQHKIDLVLLLGYMRKVGSKLIQRYGWRDDYLSVFQARMLNTHPGLLPETTGLFGVNVQQHVLDKKRSRAGQTLHVASAKYDDGPIVAEHRIMVEPGETAEELFARVQKLEKENLVVDVNDFIVERKKFLKKGEPR
ncbi:amidophosphoribosyltransferase [Candidatus Saccharibacteria bacterium]|nr:amidophosphoribosyltransferase [Candidatus Saccharibacteria bacterium]